MMVSDQTLPRQDVAGFRSTLLKAREQVKIGFWNVRTLLHTGKLA